MKSNIYCVNTCSSSNLVKWPQSFILNKPYAMQTTTIPMKQTKQSKQYYLDLVDDEDDQQQFNAGEVAYDDFSAESTTAIKSGNTPANKNDGLVYRSKHVREM
jgi:hypothetical protein